MPEMQRKTYLGDGVHAGHDSFQIWTSVSDGLTEHSHTALEAGVMANLIRYAREIYGNAWMRDVIDSMPLNTPPATDPVDVSTSDDEPTQSTPLALF